MVPTGGDSIMPTSVADSLIHCTATASSGPETVSGTMISTSGFPPAARRAMTAEHNALACIR